MSKKQEKQSQPGAAQETGSSEESISAAAVAEMFKNLMSSNAQFKSEILSQLGELENTSKALVGENEERKKVRT